MITGQPADVVIVPMEKLQALGGFPAKQLT